MMHFLHSPMRKMIRPVKYLVQQALLQAASPFAAALSRCTQGNAAYDAFSRHGFHLLRKHYYLPIPDQEDLQDRSLHEPSELVGVDMNGTAAADFTRNVLPKYNQEFRDRFPLQATGNPREFHLINGGFMAGDAHAYYAFIRHGKPRQIIEIGGGNSTLLAAAASQKNCSEGNPCRLTVIEPYPSDVLREGLPGVDEIIPLKLQQVALERFTRLGPGDILFIDSSHVLRPGGDVQREYCEILPRLASRVLVHIHDISLPKPYFPFYFQNHLYWNEQYLLQAFLTYNSRFEVLWPGTYLLHRYPEMMYDVFPEIAEMRRTYPLAEPSSFWMRVR